MPPLLLLQDIALTFGAAPLLSGAGLAVVAGDRICLEGRNGSGKCAVHGLINTIRGYAAEFDVIAARCPVKVAELLQQAHAEEVSVPALALDMLRLLAAQLEHSMSSSS